MATRSEHRPIVSIPSRYRSLRQRATRRPRERDASRAEASATSAPRQQADDRWQPTLRSLGRASVVPRGSMPRVENTWGRDWASFPCPHALPSGATTRTGQGLGRRDPNAYCCTHPRVGDWRQKLRPERVSALAEVVGPVLTRGVLAVEVEATFGPRPGEVRRTVSARAASGPRAWSGGATRASGTQTFSQQSHHHSHLRASPTVPGCKRVAGVECHADMERDTDTS